MDLIVDGKKVFAATGGQDFDPQKPALLFLHGAGCDRTTWRLQTRYFAYHGRSVLAVDLPGHGRSAGQPLATIAEMAEWVMRLLDAAKLKSAALIGHSMGALIALQAAATHPDRVWALGLLGVAQSMPVHPELLAAARAHQHKCMELMANWGIGRPLQMGGMKSPGLWLTGEVLRVTEHALPGSIGTDMAACVDYGDASIAAKQVRCPTMFVLGELDMMTPPANARALAAAVEGSETSLIAGAGHFMMVERPDQTLDALKEIV